MGVLEGKGYTKGVPEFEQDRFMKTMDYFYSIMSEVFMPPSKILVKVENTEGAVFWSEEDRKTTIENYRNTIIERAFVEKEEVLSLSKRTHSMGVRTASLAIMDSRGRYGIDDQTIFKIGEGFIEKLKLPEFTRASERIALKIAKASVSKESKDISPNLEYER